MKEIIRECGQGCVKLWMAGHDHDGNYDAEVRGPEGNIIHHVVPPAPIECEEMLPLAMSRFIITA